MVEAYGGKSKSNKQWNFDNLLEMMCQRQRGNQIWGLTPKRDEIGSYRGFLVIWEFGKIRDFGQKY